MTHTETFDQYLERFEEQFNKHFEGIVYPYDKDDMQKEVRRHFNSGQSVDSAVWLVYDYLLANGKADVVE